MGSLPFFSWFGNATVGLFFFLPFLFCCFLCELLSSVLCLECFFFLYVWIDYGLWFAIPIRYGDHPLYVYRMVGVAVLFFAVVFSGFCISFLFLCLLVWVAYLSVGDLLPLYYLCLYWWVSQFKFPSFYLWLFSFLPRNVPLIPGVYLVWRPWSLLAFVCLKSFVPIH